MGIKYEKCPRYWRGCFSCRWYLGPEKLFFCQAYNRKTFGAEIVEVEVKEELEKERGAWWSRRKSL